MFQSVSSLRWIQLRDFYERLYRSCVDVVDVVDHGEKVVEE
jgi:hypothetical protein